MEVDQERLRADIEANAAFGAIDAEDGRGRTVLTGSEADREARERFVERLTDAGLDVRVDAVGNIAGRFTPESCDPEAAPVALGSHLDSVRRGGIFDGPLGTYGALEAVRAIEASDTSLERPLDVVCFTDEEGGRFGVGTLGSSVATGTRDAGDALALEADGVTLGAALERTGFAGTDRVDAREWGAWVELHIEQGTRLTEAGAAVGVVESVTGITNCAVEITGEADHAGATPMDERTDALAAAAEFVLDLECAAREAATESAAAVATAGAVRVEPNVRNVVPGGVSLELDIRDVAHDRMDGLVERCRSSLARLERSRGVATTLERRRDTPPTHLSQRCVDAAETAAAAGEAEAIRLHSAAMHDTANVADVTDAGLVFAPSVDGVSHSPREWTDWADCAVAVGVLAETVRSLASI